MKIEIKRVKDIPSKKEIKKDIKKRKIKIGMIDKNLKIRLG